MGADTAAAHRLQPLAWLVNYSVRGGDPIAMLDVLPRAKVSINDFDEMEINDAFDPVVLAWQDALAVDPEAIGLHAGVRLGPPSR
jgi:acetyl-CoA C-acetyltransferase